MNTLIISASPRDESLSLRFSVYLKAEIVRHHAGGDVQIIGFEAFDFPSSGRAVVSPYQLSPFQRDLVDKWAKADLVIFCLPEYNWTTSGEVFTMLEQLGTSSFSNLFDEKVFAMVGISSGRGGRIPALEVGKVIEKLISFLGKMAVVSPKIFEAHEVGLHLREDSSSTGNPVFESWVIDFVRYTLKFQNRWESGAKKQESQALNLNFQA